MGALMGLTGAGFVTFLVIIALVAMAVCVRLLPRYSGQVVARTGLLVGTQGLMLLALLALVNSDMQFYSSWRDLFGMSAGAVRILDGSTGAPTITPTATPSQDALTRRLPAGDGRLDAVDVRGPRSGLDAHAYVYVPPQYASARRQSFPVVLFLAPPRELIARQHLPQLAAREIAAGRLPPVLIVMAPSPGCVDAPGGAQGETYLSEDLPATIGAAYRVEPNGWSVAGPGTEGYCAALLAMRHSDRFGAAVFAAGALAPPGGNLYGGSRDIRDEYDPRWRLRHEPPPPISVGVVGDDGFTAEVRAPMRAEPLPPNSWQDLPNLLRWLGAHLTPGSRS